MSCCLSVVSGYKLGFVGEMCNDNFQRRPNGHSRRSGWRTSKSPQEKNLWYDAILVLAEEWLLPYTTHRVMMASCVTGQMARAMSEIADWDTWEAKVKRLQRTYWSNDLVWLQRHLIRVRDNPRLRMTEEDAPTLDPFDRVRQWVELGSATYLTMREVVWPEVQVD